MIDLPCIVVIDSVQRMMFALSHSLGWLGQGLQSSSADDTPGAFRLEANKSGSQSANPRIALTRPTRWLAQGFPIDLGFAALSLHEQRRCRGYSDALAPDPLRLLSVAPEKTLESSRLKQALCLRVSYQRRKRQVAV